MAEGGAEAGGGVLFRLLRCACPLAVASAPTPPGWRQEGEGLVVGTPAMSETIMGVTSVAEIALVPVARMH